MPELMVEFVPIDPDYAMQDACHQSSCDQPADFFFRAGSERICLCEVHARRVGLQLSEALFQKRALAYENQGAPSGIVRHSG